MTVLLEYLDKSPVINPYASVIRTNSILPIQFNTYLNIFATEDVLYLSITICATLIFNCYMTAIGKPKLCSFRTPPLQVCTIKPYHTTTFVFIAYCLCMHADRHKTNKKLHSGI